MKPRELIAWAIVAAVLLIAATPNRPFSTSYEVFTSAGTHTLAKNGLSYCFLITNDTGTASLTLKSAITGITGPTIAISPTAPLCLDDKDGYPISGFTMTLNSGAAYEADIWETP